MKLLPTLLIALTATLLSAGAAPNFIIIYADDLGYTQTSVPMMKNRPELAHELHQTPSIEKLAARGMRFSGDFKLMRQLNTGEIKLFNVANDMGESEELSKQMPDKTQEMIRKLDSYLEKVGAWTMEEVYETRQEELDMWIERDKQRVTALNEELAEIGLSADERTELKAELESVEKNLARHRQNSEQLDGNRASSRWF